MAHARDFRRIFAYNYAVLHAFADRLERLPWAVVSKDREVTWHSMAGVFHHILNVHDAWLNHVIQGSWADLPMAKRGWRALRSVGELQEQLDAVEAGANRLLGSLTDAGLHRRVKAGWQPKACSVADALAQVTLEQAHHTGEIIAMLWQEDLKPAEMTWLATNWRLEDLAKKPPRGRRGKGR